MTRQTIDRFDLEGMYEAIHKFPEYLKSGREQALKTVPSKWPGSEIRSVVIAGMGGSAIGGDILRALANDQSRLPVMVCRSYSLPNWVGTDTAVIASSYSGNTEETLSAFDDALSRGARMLVISTGGELTSRAHTASVPCIELPLGIQPRAALPYSLSAVLTVTELLGVTNISSQDWNEAVEVLSRLSLELSNLSSPDNLALRVANALYGHFPVIYSSEQLSATNTRWKNQIHENSKTFAVGNLLPEMNHNEVMGWARFNSELKQLAVIALRDKEDHHRTQRRLDVTKSLLEPHAQSWHEIHSQGDSQLTRLLSLIYIGDWVSIYLAILNKTDPSPVGLISQLKAALVEDS